MHVHEAWPVAAKGPRRERCHIHGYDRQDASGRKPGGGLCDRSLRVDQVLQDVRHGNAVHRPRGSRVRLDRALSEIQSIALAGGFHGPGAGLNAAHAPAPSARRLQQDADRRTYLVQLPGGAVPFHARKNPVGISQPVPFFVEVCRIDYDFVLVTQPIHWWRWGVPDLAPLAPIDLCVSAHQAASASEAVTSLPATARRAASLKEQTLVSRSVVAERAWRRRVPASAPTMVTDAQASTHGR